MRVGVYVDAYNLYYGGRRVCGRGLPGWRWLDVRELVRPFAAWSGAVIDRVVYCTALVSPAESASASVDQNIYVKALLESGAVDHVELGRYVSWSKESPLVVSRPSTKTPEILVASGAETWTPDLPLRRTPEDHILATVRKREEKGSDVNVATHLLHDVLTERVDAAIVVSNDSDLALPLRMARERVPVGTVNPSLNQLAGALRGDAGSGASRHWWKRLRASDFMRSQLPNPVGRLRKPEGW